MKPQEGPSESRDAVALARLLATAAADTLMRDLYLGRARALLEPICSEAGYRSALDNRIAVNRLLAQSRTAVGRQDWAQVEELATRAAQLRSALDTEEDALVAAEEVYGAHPVALDPFSRGLAQFAKTDAAHVLSETLAAPSSGWPATTPSGMTSTSREAAPSPPWLRRQALPSRHPRSRG
jgi:hypothetical protein